MTSYRLKIFTPVLLITYVLITNAQALQCEEGSACDPLPELGTEYRDKDLTLTEVTQIALQRSPDQVRLEAMNETSRALFRRARNLLGSQPTLNVSGRSDQWQSDEGVREYQLGVDLPMWRIGERSAGRDLAEKSAEWVSAEWNNIRLQMAGTVREMIWDYALAENSVESTSSALEMAQKTESDMERRVKLGELSRSDLLLAQQQTLLREEELSAAKAEHYHALTRYEVIAGSRRMPGQWREQKAPIEVITDTHPALYTLSKDVERARSEVLLLRKERGEPVTVGVTGYRAHAGGVGEDYNDSLQLNVGVPFGPISYRDVKLAELQQKVADAQAGLVTKRRQLTTNLHEAEHAIHRLEEALSIAEKSRRLSEEQLRMAQTAFKVGESNLFALLLVQNKFVQASRQYRESRIKLQRAIARYNQALGVIL
ncbi:MAG: TolC family protein [Gammaproteobacteria bacterium]|nr:TolC family protein [Gammaproteobacteria bacterium]